MVVSNMLDVHLYLGKMSNLLVEKWMVDMVV